MPSYKAPYLVGWSCFYFQLPDLEWRHVHTKIPAVVVGKMKKRERKKKRQSNVNVSRCSKEASCRLGWFIFDVADGGRQPSSTHAASSTTPTIEATRTWLGADIPIWYDLIHIHWRRKTERKRLVMMVQDTPQCDTWVVLIRLAELSYHLPQAWP